MAYKYVLLFACFLIATPRIFAQTDSLRQARVLDEVQVNDKASSDFDNLRKIDGMKITVGKKTEVINVEQLTVNKSNNNTRQLYAKVTGLNIFENDGSGLQLSIGGRGLDPNRTANFNVRQNGYDISADALGYPESYYTPPADALQRIEIIKGAASLQFGTQFGGLVNFKMKPAGGNKPFELTSKQTLGSWNFFGSFNRINGHIGKKIDYIAYAHYKRGDGWRPNSGFNAINAYTEITYRVNDQHKISFQYTLLKYLAQQPGGLDDRMYAQDPRQSNRARNWFDVSWNLFSIEWLSQISPNTSLQTTAYGLMAHRKALGFRPNRPAQTDPGGKRDLLIGTFQNYALESRLLHHYQLFGKRQSALIGVRIYKGNTLSKQGNVDNGSGADFTFHKEVDELISDYRFPNLNMAAFAEQVFRLSDRWSITPGLRFEFIQTRSTGTFNEIIYDLRDSIISKTATPESRSLARSFLIGGLGSSYQFRQDLELYGNISQNYRSVTFSDIQLVNASLEIDPNIRDEKGWSADLGLRGNLGTSLRFDISGFHLYYGNKIGEYFFARTNGQVIRRRGNIGVAQISGLESFLELNILHALAKQEKQFKLSVYSNLALTHSRISKSKLPNVLHKQVEYVPEVNWKTGIQSQYKQLKVSVQLSHLSQQYTDATNATSGNFSGVIGLLPAYTLIDLSAAWRWKYLLIELSLNNLGNATYTTRRATGYPGPGIIPGEGRAIYATLGVQL
ncbi:TonB-dependent receptor domain-containing protein [Taibaiella sp. KBW10]|uniref:TonB-dependent receptor family protein n=1 Tax=Taibaiella sp. KBW10 TaxID=2153357 RepID=UPI001315A95B|nr:TonB-dependent receptor [Taibaiella sp. KBW10]